MSLASVERRELLEMALRPLGALGTNAEFPQDEAGVEALIGRLAKGRPSKPKRFAYEDPGQLPRYDGKRTTWLSRAGDGALRVRQEHRGTSLLRPSSSIPTAGSASLNRSTASAFPIRS